MRDTLRHIHSASAVPAICSYFHCTFYILHSTLIHMFTLSRLPSGLPVLTAPTVGTESITVLIFAGAGSRYEVQGTRGISHFLEHMFFKGGKKYKTAAEVSRAIDAVGGSFNAFTGKEYAGYYVKIAAEKVELACSVLSDMLLHARFPEEEIEKERGVIMEEYRMYQDTPMYQAGWDFEELVYGDQPLDRKSTRLNSSHSTSSRMPSSA